MKNLAAAAITLRSIPDSEPKALYQRPTLLRHQMGLMNKFGRVQQQQALSHVDGVSIEALLAKYASPLFVFSQQTIIDRYRELHHAFTRRYPKVRIAWSYKTNYLAAICRTMHEEGAWAEVVSPFEYEKARGLGVPPERIHFNGPLKTDVALEEALVSGSIVHLDHFDELARAEAIAKRCNVRPEVAIRINLTVEGLTCWDRFGFNLESGQARDAAARIVSGGQLVLAGLHCHIGTFINTVEPYGAAAKKLAQFANELRQRFGTKLSFLDFGGGFASPNTLKSQYLPGEQSSPSFARYADAITDGLSALEYAPDELPTLVLETGRALVDDAGYLVSTVHANKRLSDGRRGLVLDAGVNVLFTSFWYRHDVLPVQPARGLPEPTVLYGPLCMNIDVLRDTMQFPPMEPGQQVVFKNVGAYNVTQWMQFIAYRPAVVMIGKNGQHGLIRRREDLESITSNEEMPAWMR